MSDAQDIIIAVVKVKWKSTFTEQLHDTVTYVLSHIGKRSNRKLRAEITKWLKIPTDSEQVYTQAEIIKFVRTDTNDSANELLVNGFVHVNMETMSVSYYGVNDEDEEEGTAEPAEVNT